MEALNVCSSGDASIMTESAHLADSNLWRPRYNRHGHENWLLRAPLAAAAVGGLTLYLVLVRKRYVRTCKKKRLNTSLKMWSKLLSYSELPIAMRLRRAQGAPIVLKGSKSQMSSFSSE